MILEKINFVDEVPEGEPKFNITDNGDGTKNIELANNIIQEGTNLNKLTFDKIDTALKVIEKYLVYNIPTYNQVVTKNILKAITTFSGSGTITTNGANIYTTGGVTTEQTGYGPNMKFLVYATANNYTFYVGANMFEITDVTGWGNGGNANLYYSTDGGNTYNLLGNIPNQSHKTLVCPSGTNMIKATTSVRSSGSGGVYIENIGYREKQAENKFTISDIVFSENNQFIKINTPSNVNTSGISQNKLNDILIDTLLTSNKYYELVYNQSQNKFIAKQVRV